MRIRSVTIFDSPENLASAGRLASAARERLTQLGYEVQTTRCALPEVNVWRPKQLLPQVKDLDRRTAEAGIEYLSIGPVDAEHLPSLPAIFADTQRIFASIHITEGAEQLHTGLLPRIAKTIRAIAGATPQGFGNLRFAVLANCPARIPFFPAAYASGPGDKSFALAVEGADLALAAALSSDSANAFMSHLRQVIETHARKIEPVMDALASGHGSQFAGIDWSLAPHPDEERSIVAALERISGATFGNWGTLSAVALLTRAIKSAAVRQTGFCGVFLPVLEDAMLARRAADGTFDLQRLLLYSSVCGAGLDTIPLPGDVSEEAMSALLADVGTLSLVLKKPLTVRLMPVPGLSQGNKTNFDFPYLVNTVPMELSGSAPKLLRDENIRYSKV